MAAERHDERRWSRVRRCLDVGNAMTSVALESNKRLSPVLGIAQREANEEPRVRRARRENCAAAGCGDEISHTHERVIRLLKRLPLISKLPPVNVRFMLVRALVSQQYV